MMGLYSGELFRVNQQHLLSQKDFFLINSRHTEAPFMHRQRQLTIQMLHWNFELFVKFLLIRKKGGEKLS